MKNYMHLNSTRSIVRGIVPVLLLSLLIPIILIYCNATDADDTINLYCCSSMKDVVVEGIIPAFQKMQMAQYNRDVNFNTNFRGSVELTSIIISEQTADIAILSSEIDATRLLNRGVLTEESWLKSPHKGTIVRSPVLIVYNSEETGKISDFDELGKLSVHLIHSSPLHSGLGQWGIMACYGSFLSETNDSGVAMERLKKLWHSVTLRPISASMARDQYTKKLGNAIITCESELLGSSNRQVMDGEVCVPSNTILCEPKVVTIPQDVSPSKKQLIRNFQKFLWSDRAQQIFVDYGFRSVADRLNKENKRLVELNSTFTLDDLGGVKFAKCELIEDKWQNEIRIYYKNPTQEDLPKE